MNSFAAYYRCLLLLFIPFLVIFAIFQFNSTSPTSVTLLNETTPQYQLSPSTLQTLTTTTTTKPIPTTTRRKCKSYNVSDTRPFFERESPQTNLPRQIPKSSHKNLRHRLRHLRLVVVACARDVEQHVNRFRKYVEPIVNLFHPSSKILIFENDSKDNTLAKLKQWSRAQIYTSNNLSTVQSRTERIAYCRNDLLHKARKLQPDYMLTVDVDIFAVNVTTFLSNFDYDANDWSVMTANLVKFYYDMWALRTLSESILNFDVWHFVYGTASLSNYCAGSLINNAIIIHEKPYPIDRSLLEVRSAFNGAGLYKMKHTEGCEYFGQGSTCEHVAFHTCIREKHHGRIFINPKFTNEEAFQTLRKPMARIDE